MKENWNSRRRLQFSRSPVVSAVCRTRSPTGRMMPSKMRWLLVVQLLLSEQALCRSTSPLTQSHTQLPSPDLQDTVGSLNPDRQTPLRSKHQGRFRHVQGPEGQRVHSARRMISVLRERLVGQIHNHIQRHQNVSCEELLSASTLQEPGAPLFPQELLGLSLVPVLAVADCHQEAVALMLQLYDLLGVADTEELLVEVEALMEERMHQASTSAPTPAETPWVDDLHMEAVMFNIQQLAGEGKSAQGTSGREKPWEPCGGWAQVNGTLLLGKTVEGAGEGLEEALRDCESLGLHCAGVTRGGPPRPGPSKYQAVLKKGSRAVPAEAPGSECWIRACGAGKDALFWTAGRRWRRSPGAAACTDRREQSVFGVVEWIPAVGTLYSLGTAVYYASLNCSHTARERAVLGAVDLGTDALMAATGGAAGLAGYAVGAGVKTSVKASIKYLLGSMKQEEDLMVNQHTWEEAVLAMQEE